MLLKALLNSLYFNEASVDIKLLLSLIRGIIDSKLISRPIQALNQELEETVIIVSDIPVLLKDPSLLLFLLASNYLLPFRSLS